MSVGNCLAQDMHLLVPRSCNLLTEHCCMLLQEAPIDLQTRSYLDDILKRLDERQDLVASSPDMRQVKMLAQEIKTVMLAIQVRDFPHFKPSVQLTGRTRDSVLQIEITCCCDVHKAMLGDKDIAADPVQQPFNL